MKNALVHKHGKLTVKATTKNHVTISGYASVFGVVDNHNDIVVAGAFGKRPRRDIKFLWQHDQAKPIGVVSSILEDEYGLYVECNINSTTVLGQEAISLIDQGAINGLSIGFVTKDAQYNDLGQREITAADLYEVSIVTFPANEDATINRISTALDAAHHALTSLNNQMVNL